MVTPKDGIIPSDIIRNDLLRQLEDLHAPGASNSTSVSAALLEAAIKQLSQPQEPSRTSIEIEPARPNPQAAPLLVEDFLDNMGPLKSSAAPAMPDLGERTLTSVSLMDPESLKREEPFGSISPPVTSRLFCQDELRIPVASGFTFGLSLKDLTPQKRTYQAIELDSGEPEVSIRIPSNALSQNILPIPLDCKVSFATTPLSVSAPTLDDPCSWRAKFPKNTDVEFAITQGQMPTLTAAQLKEVLPSLEEQAFIRASFPLPEGLRRRLEAAAEGKDAMSVFELVTFYMQGTDPRTGMSNFRYVNHEAFGKFIVDNSEEALPLMVSALKVGHCDLLSWYAASLLRGYGAPAWASSELLPTKDGKAFNGSYSHARVVFADKNGKLEVWDPTTRIEVDRAYAPENLSVKEVDKLQKQFEAASSPEEKWKVCLLFRQARDQAREDLPKDSAPTFGAGFSALFQTLAQVPAFEPSASLREKMPLRTGATIDYAASLDSEIKIITVLAAISCATIKHSSNHLEYSIADVASRTDRQRLLSAFTAAKRLELRSCNLFLYQGMTKTGSLPPHIDKPNPFGTTLIDLFTDIVPEIDLKNPFRPSGLYPRYPVHSLKTGANYFLNSVNFTTEDSDLSRLGEVNTLGWGLEVAKSIANPSLLAPATKVGAFPSDFVTGSEIHYQYLRDSAKQQVYLPASIPMVKAIFGAWLQIQDAVTDPQFRAKFNAAYGLSEKDFWQVVKNEALIDTDKRRPYGQLGSVTKEMYRALAPIAGLGSDCATVVNKSLRSALQKLDSLAAKTPTKEPDDLREYQAGDDLRHFDWKAYGRTDRLLVRSAHSKALSDASPVYVAIDDTGANFDSRFHLLEMVQQLQKDRSRTVYVGMSGGAWVKLTPQLRAMPAGELIDRLPRLENEYADLRGIRLPDGTLPRNLLYVSPNFLKCLAYDELYASRQCRVATIWLNDPALFVWPQIKQSWVDKGK